MKQEMVTEVIACLSEDRTLFRYFKGQYAAYLLSCISRSGTTVQAVKQSPFRRLLEQPDVRKVLSINGSGSLMSGLFDYVWSESCQSFVLTLGQWGAKRWSAQTTRNGYNLVLQMNFSEQHNRAYQRLLKPTRDHVFNYVGHPVAERQKNALYRDTLAWARLDFDLDTGEALIEEIQSDWVRRVRTALSQLNSKGKIAAYYGRCLQCDGNTFRRYAEEIFLPFASIWSEAMLTAAIRFIREELGIDRIYYHAHESGALLKGIHGSQPPRSLYTDLPRKFCFQVTDQSPEFIREDRIFKRKCRAIRTKLLWHELIL
ncbi:hypothetical protein [Gynuella sp.]|uniref:hypothetical protein n=1 Tax=Gynuella sp. TaxID=2969146 RepID=UPI003D0EE2C1